MKNWKTKLLGVVSAAAIAAGVYYQSGGVEATVSFIKAVVAAFGGTPQ